MEPIVLEAPPPAEEEEEKVVEEVKQPETEENAEKEEGMVRTRIYHSIRVLHFNFS